MAADYVEAMNKSHDIESFSTTQARAVLPQLVTLLKDAVHDGASIGFLSPLANDLAEQYWHGVFAEMEQGHRILFVSRTNGEITGSVQLALCSRQNGRHRAEVQKLFVHTRHRKHGFATALMKSVEAAAKNAGRTLLVLDTEPGKPAELMYRKQGWKLVGNIPNYACSPDGCSHGTAIYYRSL